MGDSARQPCSIREPSAELPALSLVVLQSADIEAAKVFYSRLGMSFVQEQYGQGPRHYSAILGPLVLEIYPCQENNMPTPVRIGFHVARLDEILESLRVNGTRIIRPAQDSPWGRRAVVEDPDGNRVELASASPTPTSQS
jgi:lactoylglutathione lyase